MNAGTLIKIITEFIGSQFELYDPQGEQYILELIFKKWKPISYYIQYCWCLQIIINLNEGATFTEQLPLSGPVPCLNDFLLILQPLK